MTTTESRFGAPEPSLNARRSQLYEAGGKEWGEMEGDDELLKALKWLERLELDGAAISDLGASSSAMREVANHLAKLQLELERIKATERGKILYELAQHEMEDAKRGKKEIPEELAA
jgi:hypothetical protein